MHSVVTCFSQTGNTRKVADAIAGALPGDVPVTDLGQAALDEADVVFVGMPVVRFGAPDQARAFLQDQCRGRRVALFVTHAAGEDTPELQPWLQTCRDAAEGCEIVGFFHCQGQLAEPVKQYMLASDMPDLVRFAELAGVADGQPDETRLDAARRFAEQVASDFSAGPGTPRVSATA
jgi:flavodoxin